MIQNDLTIGRVDNGYEPFTNAQIETFIQINHDNIQKTIEHMINDYTNDGELELLEDPLFDWIGEYLYLFVNTSALLC